MSTSQHAYAAEQYGVRAQDYVTSAVHSSGADLDQIEAFAKALGRGRVLDLGCGGGHVTYRAAPHVTEVVASDVTQSMLDAVTATAAERGLTNIVVQQAAAEALPFPDASFDAVLCRFTTHHWSDMEGGMRQARRVLKPGCHAVFVDTVAPGDRTLDTYMQAFEVLRDPSHVRNYSVAELIAALSRAGFAVEGITMRTLRMEFDTWTARTRTPPANVQGIRALQDGAPPLVRERFAIGPDGSFDILSAALVVRAG